MEFCAVLIGLDDILQPNVHMPVNTFKGPVVGLSRLCFNHLGLKHIRTTSLFSESFST